MRGGSRMSNLNSGKLADAGITQVLVISGIAEHVSCQLDLGCSTQSIIPLHGNQDCKNVSPLLPHLSATRLLAKSSRISLWSSSVRMSPLIVTEP